MNNDLRNTLKLLHDTIQLKRTDEAKTLLSDIKNACNTHLTSSELELYCSFFFKDDHSILTFIKTVGKYNEFAKCLENCLQLLNGFISKIGNRVIPFLSHVNSACSAVFCVSRSSANKAKALQILIKVVEFRKLSWDSKDDFDVSAIAKSCLMELGQRSGTTTTVKGCCYHLLGVLAEYYPQKMINNSERLYDVYLKELNKQLTSKHSSTETKLVEGILKGLSSLLVNFTKSIDECPEICQDIYDLTTRSIRPLENLDRYAIPIAGLQLLAKHASQFGKLLVNNYEEMYDTLLKWFYHSNNSLKHEAHEALDSFLQQVAMIISQEESDVHQAKTVAIFFIRKFHKMLNAPDVSSKTFSLAIRGYGLFAGSCKRYMESGNIQKMFMEIMNRCEDIYFKQNDGNYETDVHQLPSFLQSLACIVKEMNENDDRAGRNENRLSSVFQRTLSRLCVLAIGGYPRLNKKFTKPCCHSLLAIYCAFSSCPDALQEFVSAVVYQGLIRVCSHKVIIGEDRDNPHMVVLGDQEDDVIDDILMDARTITYRHYLSLWEDLITTNKSLGHFSSAMNEISERRVVQELIYNNLLTAIITIITKLNLSVQTTTPAEAEDFQDRPTVDTTAENIIDFCVFVNLTDFCRELLPMVTVPDITGHVFEERAGRFVYNLIANSTRFPSVSGYYKLLATTMNLCTKIEYFKPCSSNEGMEVESSTLFASRDCCGLLVKKFVTEVISHLVQWKDDLLASCLFFILSLPSQIASGILPDIISPIQRALRLGLSYTPLAETAMDALERWRDDLTLPSVMETFKCILPDLEPFLHITSRQEEMSALSYVNSSNKKTLSSSALKVNESAVKKICTRVIRFLGSMGGQAHVCLEGSKTTDFRKSGSPIVEWDIGISVPYSIPFQEIKLDIQLDALIPRIMELSLQSADRKTKVAACELLHSITVYVIGRCAQQDKETQPKVTGLYERLFPAILRLACDVEQVSKQLFHPLIMQIIHWFTNNRKYESDDTAVLLNSLIDGLVNEEDGSLRELCASGVNEFLTWSIKQDSGQHGTARKNAKSLFKRLFNLACHSSPAKRLGSAVAFNHFYRVFREQDVSVDEFIFEMIVVYINSLAIAHNDQEAIGTQKQCVQVLAHIERIVKHHKDLLNIELKKRRIPSGFSQSKPVTLCEVVEWLFLQCGRAQTECRHQCMKLFYEFVPLLPSSPSAITWIQNKITKEGIKYLITCFEGSSSQKGIFLHPQPLCKSGQSPLKSLSDWFDFLLASLDCYSWVLQQKIVKPSQIFKNGSHQNLFRSIDFFIHDISQQSIDRVLQSFDKNVSVGVYTPFEQEKLNEVKCTVTVRILQFIRLMLLLYPEECFTLLPQNIWESDSVPDLVATTAVSPSSLGLDMKSDVRIAENLPPLMSEILDLMAHHLPNKIREKFISLLHSKIFKHGFLTDVLPTPFNENAFSAAIGNISNTAQAYKLLNESSLLSDVLQWNATDSGGDDKTKSLARTLLRYLFSCVVGTSYEDSIPALTYVRLSHTVLEIAEKLLDLSLEIGVPTGLLIEMLLDESLLYNDSGVKLMMTHGQAFFSTFKRQLCKQFCLNSSIFVPVITQHTANAAHNAITCTGILSDMLEFLASNRNERKNHSTQLCNQILSQWNTGLFLLWDKSASLEYRKAAVNILTKIVSLDSSVCKDPSHPSYHSLFKMFSDILTSQTLPLVFKTQAMELFAFFCLPDDEERQTSVQSTLDDLCSLHFPTQSSEFLPGSKQYNEYVAAVRKILLCFELSGSTGVLNVLVKLFCREKRHALEEEFIKTFEKSMKNTSMSNQKDLLEVPYTLFSNPSFSVEIRARGVLYILVPMFSCCSSGTANKFFCVHIGDIMKYVMEHQSRISEDKWKNQLAIKSCCYKLLEIMFSLLPAEDFKSDSSQIVQAFASTAAGGGSTKLLKTFMGNIIRDKNEDMTNEKQLLEERRKFHCFLYNAVISAVVCTQTDVKWFDAFIFSDNRSKREFLFDNIINQTHSYSFPVETDEPLEKRKRFITIRKKYKDTLRDDDSSYQSVAYLSSIAASSLSEDVTKFDSNLSRTLQEKPSSQDPELASPRSPTPSSATASISIGLELERDEINEHECMSNLISLLIHMHEHHIGFPNEDEVMETDQPPVLPKWMNAIIKKLIAFPTSINVKIFIAKLVVNCEEIFRPFAFHWISPLIKTVLSHMRKKMEEGDSLDAGCEIDQFVVDVVATILSWSTTAIPKEDMEDKMLVRTLLEYLMKNASHENRAVTRHNLDLIKTMLECWQKRISGINTDVIYEQCSSTDPKSTNNYCGLQLLGALLANGNAPYTPSVDVGRKSYFQRIAHNLLSERKEIMDTAGEVVGMSLKHLAEDQKESQEEIHDLIKDTLKRRLQGNQGIMNFGVFLSLLQKLSQHHPPAAEPFLSRILFDLPRIHGSMIQTCCINILQSSSDKIPDLYIELKSKGFINMLIHRDEGLQMSCLKLCLAMVHNTTEHGSDGKLHVKDMIFHRKCVMFFLPSAEDAFRRHSSYRCREILLHIAMVVYDIQKSLPQTDQSEEIMSLSKLILLRNLNDPQEIIRSQASNFWSEDVQGTQHQVRLPPDPAGKIIDLFGDLYQPGIDDAGFLASTCNLVMKASSRSPDFHRKIYDHPLSECVFQEFSIDHKWQHRHSTMTPMFVDTYQSTLSHSLSSLEHDTTGPKRPRMIEATQKEMQFSATVDVSGKNTLNWMTGSSVDTFASLDSYATGDATSGGQSKSAVLAVRKFGKVKPVGAGFGEGRLKSLKKNEYNTYSLDLMRLRRRLQKESPDSRIRYARAAERKRKQKESLIKQGKATIEHSVQIYRKYRMGELPDIQILHKDLIAPLAALAELDSILARRLLSSLISAIARDYIQNSYKKEFMKKLENAFTRVLDMSSHSHPAFTGCIFEVLLQHASSFKIEPSIISRAAIKANVTSLGMRILEEWLLLVDETKQPVSKRQKLVQATHKASAIEIQQWIELARLYCDDYDILRGIFVSSPIARSVFRDALHFETLSNYSQAYTSYKTALDTYSDVDSSFVEKEILEDSMLNCLKNLGKWEDVDKFCDEKRSDGNTVADLENVWNNSTFQQRFLPSAMHAKLTLLLRGNENYGNQLTEFIDNAMQHGGERRKLIESEYADYLTMLNICKGDYNQASYYLQMSADAFASQWASTDSSETSKQSSVCCKIFCFSDVADFIDLMLKHPGKKLSCGSVTCLVSKWTSRLPHNIYDSMDVWEDMLSCRLFLIDHLVGKFSESNAVSQSQDGNSVTSPEKDLEKNKLFFLLRAVDSACSQTRFTQARNFLNGDIEHVMNLLKLVDGNSDLNKQKLQQSQHWVKYYLSYAHHWATIGGDVERAAKATVRAHSKLSSLMDNLTGDILTYEHAHHRMLWGQTFDHAFEMLDCHHDSEEIFKTLQCLSLRDKDNTSYDTLKEDIQTQAYKHFSESIKLYRKMDPNEENISDAFMCMVKFCDKALQRKEKDFSNGSQNSWIPSSKDKDYALQVVKYTLLAMRQGGENVEEVTIRFPRLLQLLENFPDDVKSCFMEETVKIPCWMFLRWTNQMVALLDKKEASCVHEIVSRISQDYPQALIYSIKTSVEDFQYQKSSGKENKLFVQKLQAELDKLVPLAQEFINNLCLLTSPAHLCKEWFDVTLQLLRTKGSPGCVISKYQELYKSIFDHGNDTLPMEAEDDSLYEGTLNLPRTLDQYWVDFNKKFKKAFDDKFGGSTGSKLSRMNEKTFLKLAENLNRDIKGYCWQDMRDALREYSSWLANFHSLHLSCDDLEIPGQYTGRTKPMPEYHAKVTGFGESITVMSSLQQPKKIKIKGSDANEYNYLLKGNEDLRQDQRIQQILEVVNVMLQQYPASWKRKLHLVTYQVIPITSRVALIQWIDKSSTLKDTLQKEAKRIGREHTFKKARASYNEWLLKCNNKQGGQVKYPYYWTVVKTQNRANVQKIYNEINSKIPPNLLRNAYIHLSASPESFILLRKRFSTTYGILCLVHWILGIGDRHADNCMLSTKTGEMIGIDFGHAFGTATELLPIPELVPFRLTPQIQYLLSPHPAKAGDLRQSMVHCLSVVRLHQETLLTMLDVFLKEPLVDWMKHAKKMQHSQSKIMKHTECGQGGLQSTSENVSPSSSRSAALQWYPLRKIFLIKKKLSGWNPSEITRDELEFNYSLQQSYKPDYEACVLGEAGIDLRRDKDRQNLSVDDQVDCLIDQATDPNILARTYDGWRFWL